MNTVYTHLCSPPTPPIPVCVSLFRFMASNSLCSSSLPFPPLPSHTHKYSLLESFSPAHMFSELISWDHLTYRGFIPGEDWFYLSQRRSPACSSKARDFRTHLGFSLSCITQEMPLVQPYDLASRPLVEQQCSKQHSEIMETFHLTCQLSN